MTVGHLRKPLKLKLKSLSSTHHLGYRHPLRLLHVRKLTCLASGRERTGTRVGGHAAVDEDSLTPSRLPLVA